MEKKIKITGQNFLVPVMDKGRIALLRNKKGKFLIPAFTSEEEFQKLPLDGVRPEVLSYERIKGMVIDDPKNLEGIIIDPFGSKLVLNHEAIENIDRMSTGMAVKRADHRGNLQLWQPAEYPAGIEQALSEHLKEQGTVREAWLLRMKEEGAEESHWTLVLDFDGDRKVVFPPTAKAMQAFMSPGETFELMKAENTLREYVKTKCTSFYIGEAGNAVLN